MNGYQAIDQGGTFLDHLGGIELNKTAESASIRMTVRPSHVNPNGTAHGGVILTLLDFSLGAEVERHLGDGLEGHPITIQLSTSMIGAARLGETIHSTSRVTASTRTMTFVSGELVSGDRVVATASAVFRNPRPREK